MNPIRQTLHLLHKDIRAQAPAIGIVLLLNLLAVVVFTRPWAERVDSESTTGFVTSALLIIAWCLLIARVIQDEGPAGKFRYWLTRPGSRGAVLAAKLAFVLLFVHLPTFLAQVAIVTGSGVPLSVTALLLNQLVFTVLVSLPAAAIASLTTSLSRFMPVAVLAAVVGVILVFEVGSVFSGIISVTALPRFGSVTLLSLVALIATAALFCQYRWRSTLRIGIGCLVALVLLGVTVRAASELIETVHATVVDSPTGTPMIRLRESPETYPDTSPLTIGFPGLPRVFVPLEWSIEEDVSVLQVNIELRADGNGRASTGGITHASMGGHPYLFGTADELWLDLSRYDAMVEDPVSIRLVVEYETFRPLETGTIPLDGGGAIIDGHAQCGMSPIAADWTLCRTASGSTRLLIPRGVQGEYLRQPPLLLLTINPISPLRLPHSVVHTDGTSVTVSVREHLRYERQEVTLENVRLDAYGPE